MIRRQNDEYNKTLLQDQASETLTTYRSDMYSKKLESDIYSKKLEVTQPIQTSSGREVFSFMSSNLDATIGDLRQAIKIHRFDLTEVYIRILI